MMKATLLMTVSMVALLQSDDAASLSPIAKKALLDFAEDRQKIEDRYQSDLDKAVDRLSRRLEVAKKDRLKRGDIQGATQIDEAFKIAAKRLRTPAQLQKELIGTKWSWRTTSGTGRLHIVVGNGWWQLSDQKDRVPFVPTSGNQIEAVSQGDDAPRFTFTFSDELKMFMYRTTAGSIRVGSRIE